MFKKEDGPKTVKRKVTIHIPDDGERFTKASLFVTFEIQAKSVNDRRMAEFEAGNPDTDWILDVVKDWDQYTEADGTTQIPFSRQELMLFCDVPYQRIALVEEYFNCANGGVGRRKN